jgi:hypothetical protein
MANVRSNAKEMSSENIGHHARVVTTVLVYQSAFIVEDLALLAFGHSLYNAMAFVIEKMIGSARRS